MYILTCDVGTTGVKCALVNASGQIVATGHAPLATEFPQPGWAQQPVEQYFPATVQAARACMADIPPGEIAVIALSGTMNGIIPVDREGNALSPNITHQDTRTAGQCRQIAQEIPLAEFYRRTGNRIDPHSSLPKALWLKQTHPQLHAKTAAFLNTKDHLYGCLTGDFASTDLSDASLAAALNIQKKQWDPDISRIGGMAGKQPVIRKSTDASGRLTKQAADALGLLAGTPVVVGAGDGACASRGAGIYAAGQAYACLGSSGWISTLTDELLIDERLFSYYDLGGEQLNFCGTVQSVTAALDFMLETVLGIPLSAQGFAAAEALALQSPSGANGLRFAPTLYGERTPLWDPDVRGSLTGIGLNHTRADFVRAVYEGVAQALYTCLALIRENGIQPQSMTLIGGGARSKVWPGMLSELFGIPVRVSPHPGEATALGAAVAGGVGVGLWPSLEEGTKVVAGEQ